MMPRRLTILARKAGGRNSGPGSRACLAKLSREICGAGCSGSNLMLRESLGAHGLTARRPSPETEEGHDKVARLHSRLAVTNQISHQSGVGGWGNPIARCFGTTTNQTLRDALRFRHAEPQRRRGGGMKSLGRRRQGPRVKRRPTDVKPACPQNCRQLLGRTSTGMQQRLTMSLGESWRCFSPDFHPRAF